MCMLHKQGGVWRRSPSLSRPSRPAAPSVHRCCWLWAPRRSAWAESRSALVYGGRKDAGGFWHTVSPLLPSPCQGGRAAAASWRLEAQSWIFRSRVGVGGQNKHQRKTPDKREQSLITYRGEKLKGRRLRFGFECQYDATAPPRVHVNLGIAILFPAPYGNLIPSTTALTERPPLNGNILWHKCNFFQQIRLTLQATPRFTSKPWSKTHWVVPMTQTKPFFFFFFQIRFIWQKS